MLAAGLRDGSRAGRDGGDVAEASGRCRHRGHQGCALFKVTGAVRSSLQR